MKHIGIELFAHINNGYAISGTRKLEGRSYIEAIDYLDYFLKHEIKNVLPQDSLSASELTEFRSLKTQIEL